MAVEAELVQKMYVKIALGVDKADFGYPLNAEASALWDRIEREVAGILATGGQLDMVEIEIPDLPPWVGDAPEATTADGGPPDDGGGTSVAGQVMLPEAGSQDDTHPGRGMVPWSVREGGGGCDGWQVVNDDTSNPVPGGCHDSERDAAAHVRALYANAGDEAKAALELGHFAEVDGTPWDGNAAMTSCTSGACYASICAGRKAGPPDLRSSWALPHHKTQGGPPNAAGVRASLARFSSTQGLTNAGAARRHLEAHMAAISGGNDSSTALQDPEELAGKGKVPPQFLPKQKGGDGNGDGDGKGGCPPGQRFDPAQRKCVPVAEGEEAAAAEATEELGGKPNPATGKDGRMKGRKGPERRKKSTSAATESKITPTGEGRFEAILVIEGIPTGDGREFAADSLDFADFPLPLTYQPPTHGGTPGPAIDVGVIEEGWRDDDNPRLIYGKGRFDMQDPEAADIYRKVEEKLLRGVSVDIDDIDPTTDVELIWPDGAAEGEGLEQLFAPPRKRIFHKGRIRGAAVLSMPAFVEAQLWAEGTDAPDLPDLGEVEVAARAREAADDLQDQEGRKAMTAAAMVTRLADHRPPRAWFQNPEMGQRSPIVVTEDLRVYGHAYQWDDCHIGYAGECVPPPREDDFPYFTQGSVECADGSTVAVGQITLGTGHAPLRGINARAASEHYDNTGSVVADVAVGVDRVGCWVAGAVRPGATPEQVFALRASGQVSGDWRLIGGRLRLVALLAVNVPGFPVPRPEARVAGGMVQALVAAGQLDVGPRIDWQHQVKQWALRQLRDEALAGIE